MRFLISEKLGPHKYKTPEGYLVCVDAILSRTGTQEYRRCEIFGDACDDPDKIITVDRKAEEVFSDKTMASFENKPICIEHPNSSVNAKNHNDLSVGFVRDIHRGEDNGTPVMMGTLVITDKEAVEAVESGEYKELSCGYDCDIADEHSPQQRNIRGNHVALCKQGRAGIARIVDSVVDDMEKSRKNSNSLNDVKLSAKDRKIISSYLNSISKYTKHDPDIIDLISPLKHKGYEIFRKNIKGWYKTSEGTMRKDYFFGINGYDNTFMVSLYANEGEWKVNEVNAYFTDSINILSNKENFMNDEHLIEDARKKDALNIYKGDIIEGDGGEWWKVTSVKKGSRDVEVSVVSQSTGEKDEWYFIKGDMVNVKDSNEHLTDMDIDELMKYYTGKNTKRGANIFKINGKYTINPNISSRRYNTIAELEAGEEKYQAQIAKGYAKNDPNQFGDSEDFQAGDIIEGDDRFAGNGPENTYRVLERVGKGKYRVEPISPGAVKFAKGKKVMVIKVPEEAYKLKDSIADSAQTQDTFTVEYVKDDITHIVEVEAETIIDAVIKAKSLFR